ncbi:MAG: excalibur calcium-binding domain-containing protein [Streptococcus parasanguinis]
MNRQDKPQLLNKRSNTSICHTTSTRGYRNCSEARAAGATHCRGQLDIAARLDRDGDGIACE